MTISAIEFSRSYMTYQSDQSMTRSWKASYYRLLSLYFRVLSATFPTAIKYSTFVDPEIKWNIYGQSLVYCCSIMVLFQHGEMRALLLFFIQFRQFNWCEGHPLSFDSLQAHHVCGNTPSKQRFLGEATAYFLSAEYQIYYSSCMKIIRQWI